MKDLRDRCESLCLDLGGPTQYPNGEPIEDMGKWHGKFERTYYPKGSMETDPNGNLKKKDATERAAERKDDGP